MTTALILFAKYPEPGKVKTRLAADIGNDLACEVYELFLDDLTCAHRDQDYDFFLSAPERVEDLGDRLDLARTHTQVSGDLGAKLRDAFEHFLKDYDKVIIIGADLPSLNHSHVHEAVKKLDSNDVVLGPTDDGGYYLIGLSEEHPELFENIPWSTETVFLKTVEKITEFGLDLGLLQSERDVDDLDDLIDLKEKSNKYGKWFDTKVDVL